MSNLQEVLKIKLERDLQKQLTEYVTANNISIDNDKLLSMIKQKIPEKIEFEDDTRDRCQRNPRKRCHARMWGAVRDNSTPFRNRGHQCHMKKVNDNYCKTHQNMLDKYGVLRFGDYFEKRPKWDLVKEKLYAKREYLHWHKTGEETINDILKYHEWRMLDAIDKTWY